MDRPTGRIKAKLEDFVVEELPAYEPSGTGEHVFVRITKTDLTTLEAVKRVARALACDAREVGFAGMKDRHGVTTQTLSVHAPRGVAPDDLATRARALEIEGVVVHSAVCHGNKLKPGHLAGNRFSIMVRDVLAEHLDDVERALREVALQGVPNAFGAQRFGRERDNASRALAWLRGEAEGPRDPRMQRLLWSSLQSSVFNAVLEARVADGTWATALEGDLLKLRSSGGLFLCADVQTDRARAETGEVSPTGPIIGTGMRWPEGPPALLERRISTELLGESFDLNRTRRLGQGTRRPLRVWVQDLRWEVVDDPSGNAPACVRVYFVLPKGAYATTVLALVFALDTSRDANVEMGQAEESSA